jgi:branched-chain amino acid transport system permease protein
LIYGVMRIVNLAHGSLYALGAYVSAWAVGGAIGAAVNGTFGLAGLFLLLPIGAFAVAALGAVIEPTLLRPLYRRPEEYHLLVTFGLLMILEDVIKLLFGGTPLTAGLIMDRMGSLPVAGLRYPTYNLVVIGLGLLAAAGLWWFIYRTRFGVILRATSQDRRMAAALGINVSRVYVQAFAIGCFMAGLGGAVVVPAQAAVLGMGVEALILAFVVVVIGGLGSLEGALVGALIVAFAHVAGVQFFAEIELAVLYLIATAVLMIRPTGLFGRA